MTNYNMAIAHRYGKKYFRLTYWTENTMTEKDGKVSTKVSDVTRKWYATEAQAKEKLAEVSK